MGEAGSKRSSIIVIDNGTQYGVLYVKRLRDLGVNVESVDAGVYEDEEGNLVRPHISFEDVKGYAGIVIAGGRSSVTDNEIKRVDIDPMIYSHFEGPVLGTCFGHQDMADRLGGKVITGLKQCGPVYTTADLSNPLFQGLEERIQRVNSTHNDGVKELPPGFEIIAYSYNELEGYRHIDAMCKRPAIGKNNWRFGTQFHPETFLTEHGNEMLANFVRICGLRPKNIEKKEKRTPNIDQVVEEQFQLIRETAGGMPIFLPISGGIDSTTATAMLLEAGINPYYSSGRKRINAFHIDTGYNRYNESREVVEQYHKMGWDFVELLDRKDFFADFSLTDEDFKNLDRKDLAGKSFSGIKLKDAAYSEHKRFLFQAAYAKVIEEYQKELGLDETNSALVQGTNQADKVESGEGGRKKSGSARIKSHHNVGRFKKKYEQAGHLLEPLNRFFKSDIYELGRRFGLPDFFRARRPFPGPGLLVRIAGHNVLETGFYTQDDINKLREIANKFSQKHNMIVYVAPVEAVGSSGDERAVGVFSVIKLANSSHEKYIEEKIDELLYVAGQIPHYTTLSRDKCITRVITPLFNFDARRNPSFTGFENYGRTVECLQIFDMEINKMVDELGIPMTQVVNHALCDNLGQEGKYTFLFRPWLAPDLMSGMPLIPEGELRKQTFQRLKQIKQKYDFIGNVCIDLTYKPIGGTEIN
jgi:GMP synthase (glutamine-hydrolysing)